MTKLKFETATIADAIRKAARVAPTKGAALDKASGIIIEIDPVSVAGPQVIVKATNLDVYYLEAVSAISVETEQSVTWRLPSLILSGVMASLPIGSDKAVTMEQDGNTVVIKQGKTTAKLRLNDPSYYPEWGAFNPALCAPVEDMGARLTAVEWAAASKGEPPLTGVHLTGSALLATDRYRLAMIPCAVPLVAPVTIPAGILGSVLKTRGDVSVGVDDDMFLLMPDDSTQIRTVIYDTKFPNLQRVFELSLPDEFIVNKLLLVEIINRAAVLTAHERVPTLNLYLGREEISVVCTDDEIGLLGDTIDISGYATHKRVKFTFTPKNIVDALMNAPSEKVTVSYSHEKTHQPLKIDGGSGYIAVAMPRSANQED